MLTTFASYQISARDINAAIDRVKSQPLVERESAYYLENIEKVETIEEFVSDYRLFSYAMKGTRPGGHDLCAGIHDQAAVKAVVMIPTPWPIR